MEVMEKEDGVRGMGMNHSTIVNVNPIPLHSTFFCWTQTEKKEEKGKTEKQSHTHNSQLHQLPKGECVCVPLEHRCTIE